MPGRAFDDPPLSILVPQNGAAVAVDRSGDIWEAIEWAELEKGVSGVKSGESLEQVFLGRGGGHRPPKGWRESSASRLCEALRARGHLARPLAGALQAPAWL